MLRPVETVALTDTGRQRRENEDSLYVREPLFVVADGMGGAQAGEVASQVAVEAFQDWVPDAGSPEEKLVEVVQEANRRIHEISRTERERRGMGTTLTAAWLDDSSVAIAHVGDSRAYLLRAGELQRLTQDHSLVAELVRRGKLTEAQAEEHPQRSIITRALGIEPSVDVDTWSYPVREGDLLLLCSDGLTSMLGEDRIVEILTGAPSLQEAGEGLIREANQAGGRDNITVILTRLEEVDSAEVEQPTFISSPRDSGPGDAEVREPVRHGSAGPVTGLVRGGAATASAESRGQTGSAAAARSGSGGRPKRRQPIPSDRPSGVPLPRRRHRFARPLAALLSSLIVLALVLAGGYLASRQLFFIGTDSQGIFTIYRGLPYDLPAGIHLYEQFYVSGVPASLVPPSRRRRLLDHHLRSQSDAMSLVRDLELGDLAP